MKSGWGRRRLHAARYAVEHATEWCGDSFENMDIKWFVEEMKLSNQFMQQSRSSEANSFSAGQ
jgi:hypothetical protein